MTVDKTLDEFISTLDALIGSARARLGDADAFQQVSYQIGDLIAQNLPPLVEAMADGSVDADAVARLEDSLARLRDLESAGQARLVWSQDLEEYIKKELSGQG